MGDLTVSISIKIPGSDQKLHAEARLCKNLNCGLWFIPMRKNHKYHSPDCKDEWINKTRPIQGITESSVKRESTTKAT